jgi:predicted lysophospholipase L1 biosynthesis ABC-type transport system permease subunit
MADENFSETVEKSSDNLIEASRRFRSGLHYMSRSLSIWFDDHSKLKWIILTLLSSIIGRVAIEMISWFHIYFFGAIVPIQRDVTVSVFPAPIGFTLWVLSVLFILYVLASYFRFVALRQRLDELETQIEDET